MVRVDRGTEHKFQGLRERSFIIVIHSWLGLVASLLFFFSLITGDYCYSHHCAHYIHLDLMKSI